MENTDRIQVRKGEVYIAIRQIFFNLEQRHHHDVDIFFFIRIDVLFTTAKLEINI